MTAAPDEDGIPYLNYRVRWRAGDVRPGRHPARHSGAGGDFRTHLPFWQLPDARRIDVRRSIVDPFENLVVRQMENRSAISVVLAADLSHSMQAAPCGSKMGALADLAQSASRSALRAGDAFGFAGFAETVDLHFAPSRSRGRAAQLVASLRDMQPGGRDASGILALAESLPERRCLVLLISDFLIPLPVIDEALGRLARHDVAPVVLHDAREADPPRSGLLRIRDAESGRARLLLMRPALRRRWDAMRTEHRASLDRIFLRHGRPAFHATGRLDVAALGEHLLSG